jgi:ribosome-associated protein
MEAPVKNEQAVVEIATFLEDHKCSDTVVLAVGEMCGWTDYFVITTVRSHAHSKGILHHLEDFIEKKALSPIHRRKDFYETGWVLIDCGALVIHLMEKEQREFYELERLWFKSPVIYQSSRSL